MEFPCPIIEHLVSLFLLFCWNEHFPQDVLVGFGCVGDVAVIAELVVLVSVGRVDFINPGVQVLLHFDRDLGEQVEVQDEVLQHQIQRVQMQ